SPRARGSIPASSIFFRAVEFRRNVITSSVVARPRSARAAPSPPADPWLTRTLWMTAAVGLAAALRLELWYWPGSIFLRVKSGVWSALAWDFAHGALYRPLVSALGYGGTRFMPLLFVTHGLLMRLGLDPVLSGAVLMHASVVAASVALFCALRASAVPATLAAPLALLPWCTIVYQQSCTDLSPDYLAAAAVLAAVVCAFGGRSESPSRLALAATLCAVAGLAKLTAVWVAVASIAIPLWVAGRRGAACR